MRPSSLIVPLLIVLVLTISLAEAKKAKKGKGNEKKNELNSKKSKKEPKVEKQKVKSEELKNEEPIEVAKPKKESLVKNPESEPKAPTKTVNHHNTNTEDLIEQPVQEERVYLVKPKSLKMVNPYEQCKMECKKKRDEGNAQQYLERLREEVRLTELAIAEQRKLQAAQNELNEKQASDPKQPVETQPDEPRSKPLANAASE